MNDRHLSKYLSLVLRHEPEDLGLQLDEAGWLEADLLLQRLSERKGWTVRMNDLQRIVDEDDKGRYTLQNGQIRANQGHSVPVPHLELEQLTPPTILYHGTTAQSWQAIQASGGLRPMSRQHVHLSASIDTAQTVAARRRRQESVLLQIRAGEMASAGHSFFRSSNGVWLTADVPLQFLGLLELP
jgi:putative RNA 2'-phosphotransferase